MVCPKDSLRRPRLDESFGQTISVTPKGDLFKNESPIGVFLYLCNRIWFALQAFNLHGSSKGLFETSPSDHEI